MTTHQELDVRPLPPSQKHRRIFELWEALPVGGVLKLINDHNPKPLFYEFEAEQTGLFQWRVGETGPEVWTVEIVRVAPSPNAAAAAPGPAPEWAAGEPKHDVDVREDLRRGEEPFAKIMAAVSQVRPGETLRLRAIFEPAPLYAVLGRRGFEHWTHKAAADDWHVWFRLRPGA